MTIDTASMIALLQASDEDSACVYLRRFLDFLDEYEGIEDVKSIVSRIRLWVNSPPRTYGNIPGIAKKMRLLKAILDLHDRKKMRAPKAVETRALSI